MFAYYLGLLAKEKLRGRSKMSTYAVEKMARGATVHFLAYPSLFTLTPNQTKPGNVSTSTASLCLQ